MRVLDDMCEILEDELHKIAKKGDISPGELENVYKSVDIIKDIKTIKAMEEGGYSYEGSYDGSYEGSYGSYNSYRGGDGMSGARRGRDGDSDGRYSERRGGSREGGSRESMGRYSREGGYSRNEETEMLRKELQDMKRKLDRM